MSRGASQFVNLPFHRPLKMTQYYISTSKSQSCYSVAPNLSMPQLSNILSSLPFPGGGVGGCELTKGELRPTFNN